MDTTLRKPTRGRTIAVLGLAGMLLAGACGGDGKKAASPDAVDSSTTTIVDETTTTTALTTDSTAAVGGTTTTSSGRTATTARRGATATTAAKNVTRAPVGSGISNVTAPATTAAPDANAQPGGIFTYLNASDPATIDANVLGPSAPSDGVIGTALYDTLMYFSSTTGSVTPQLAQSLTSSDGVVWTLKLRPNIKFSDGTPYDAAAVRFNWTRVADPATKSPSASLVTAIDKMDVLDATTLRITLKSKSGVFPNSVASPLSWIGSPAAIAKGAEQFAANPVGAGPFLFKSWVRGSAMTLVRNPTYWQAPLPYLDQLVVRPITDENQRANTLSTGAAHMLWTRVPDSKAKSEAGNAKANVLTTNGGTNAYFNTTTAPFKDQRVREAVVRAIDRAQYAKVINQNASAPMHSLFSEQSPFYDASLTQYAYDPVRAQQLFDAVAAETGGPVTFEISGFAVQTQMTQSEYMQGVLSAFKNVKVTAQTYAISAGSTKLANRDFQMMLAGSYFIDPEPAFTSRYVCAAVPNYTGYCDKRYDDLVASQRGTLDAGQRVADMKEIQKLFYAAAPSLYYDRGSSWMMTAPQVQGFDFINDGWVAFERIWLKTR